MLFMGMVLYLYDHLQYDCAQTLGQWTSQASQGSEVAHLVEYLNDNGERL